MQLTRRSLLIAGSIAATPLPAWARTLGRGTFTHGVASGDPTPEAVVLWTRFAPRSGARARIAWEIAESDSFARVVRRGSLETSAASDYCGKVDVRGLAPGRTYFYRFLSGDGPSVTGRTRTAPQGPTDSLSLAFFSCANLPWGYFHAYGDAAAREDIDLCLHVGDYIYETQRGAYPSAADTVGGRTIEPAGETVTLADYYARYASYHTDPDLLELRRLKPFSVVWDDHEFANDAWIGGAQNHQPDTEGVWSDRVAAASKAYFDWMPIRLPERTGYRIYRTLDWGDLARIVLLDTRIIGRDKQLTYQADLLPAFDAPSADQAALAAAFKRRIEDPSRSLMGATQEQWFAQQLAESKSRGQPWQIVAQQILLGDTLAPQGLSAMLPPDQRNTRNYFFLAERLAPYGLPWNLDSWTGYLGARARFLDACATQGANVVTLGGDSHNTYVNNLPAPSAPGRIATVEFDGGSVTSPGFERSLTLAAPGAREALYKSSNPNLVFTDLTNRGYGALRVTRTRVEAEWRAVSDIRVQARTITPTRFATEASATGGPSPWAL